MAALPLLPPVWALLLATSLCACSNGKPSTPAEASGGAGPAAGGSTAPDPPSAGGSGAASNPLPPGERLPAATFTEGELDPPSQGATLTFQDIGAPGGYPSRRDPESSSCDAYESGACCMSEHELTTDTLSPWNEELIMTLRGPMRVKQLAVYQPTAEASQGSGEQSLAGAWQLVSLWDEREAQSSGLAFDGNGTELSGFPGEVGSECLVDVMTDREFPCGPGSVPYCPAGEPQYHGWDGSKLLVLLAAMPHASDPSMQDTECGSGTSGNWYDAPWIGLSHGELVRSGKFGDCHCYARDPAMWWLADGCGQFNAFEVVNDNNEYRNLDLFSTNLFAYHGYVGEGPCGAQCDLTDLPGDVDLVDKTTSAGATAGAVASPAGGPGAAFRRPSAGYRFFLVLMDAPARVIQLVMVHPTNVPAALAPLLPELPHALERRDIEALSSLRLPM